MGNNRERLAHIRTTRLRGIYLPMWTFDLMGEVGWRSSEPKGRQRSSGALISISEGGIHFGTEGQGNRIEGRVGYEGTHYVLVDDAIVPASHRVPFALRGVFEQFDLSRALPYDPTFLSDWPAEIYELAVGDASLVARQQVLKKAGADIRIQATIQAGDLQNLQTFSRNLSVQSYKLLLVPVWLANYRYENETYMVVVNGQTEQVFGEQPPNVIKRALRGLLGLGG